VTLFAPKTFSFWLGADANTLLAEPGEFKLVSVDAIDSKTGKPIELRYTNNKCVGNGSFGVVFQVITLLEKEINHVGKVASCRQDGPSYSNQKGDARPSLQESRVANHEIGPTSKRR